MLNLNVLIINHIIIYTYWILGDEFLLLLYICNILNIEKVKHKNKQTKTQTYFHLLNRKSHTRKQNNNKNNNNNLRPA